LDPVTLAVKSGDQGWARQVLTSLSEEVEKGVPRWAWWRSPAGGAILGAITALIALAVTLLVVPASVGMPFRLLVGLGMGVAAQVIVGRSKFINWFLPPLEVASQGGSSGGRRLAGLGLLLLSVPIGILVNLLTE
jgi:hypothetical protein